MIKRIFLLTIILLSIAQTTVYSQNKRVVLILKDGTRLKGLGKRLPEGKMKFRKNKKEKPYIVDLKEVNKIKIYKKSGVYFRAYKKIKGKSKYKYLELIEEGRLTVYRKFKGNFQATGSNGQFVGSGKNLNDYYVEKEGEEEVVPLVTSGFFYVNFKKVALEYFKECKELIDKIEKEEFTKNDLGLIIDFYNYECE